MGKDTLHVAAVFWPLLKRYDNVSYVFRLMASVAQLAVHHALRAQN